MADFLIGNVVNQDPVQRIMDNTSISRENAKPEFASLLSNIRDVKVTGGLECKQESTKTAKEMTNESFGAENPIRDRLDKGPNAKDLDSNITEESKETLQTYNDKIKEAIMDEYQITEEELTQAMELLGLDYLQLLVPENLIQLSVEITDSANVVNLLENSDFNDLFKLLQGMTEELMGELNLSQPAFDEAMADNTFAMMLADELPNMETVNTDNTNEVEANNGLADALETMVTEGIEAGTVEVTVNVEDEADLKESKGDVEEGSIYDIEDVIPKEDTVLSKETNQSHSTKDFKGNTDSNSSQSKDNSLVQNLQTPNSFDAIANELSVEAADSYKSVETANIIRQVNEFMRLNVTSQTTSLEMQLNPENLGKIGLNVSLREGVVTAQLAVENETVKQALESQMVILRQNMDAQGLKVEAVEVTIASHEFEQNLEEGQTNPDSGSNEGQRQQEGRRSILASDLSASIADYTEDEQLAARIMVENGNSMDVSA